MPRKPPKGKSLAEVNPELAKQWHPTKNEDLTPFDFTNKSGVKVWWKCDKGLDHEWFTRIAKRSNGGQCPICSGRQLALSNCLATVNPKVAKEWHPTKNGDLTPYDVTSASGKRVWWKCDKGDDHEWEAKVLTRKNHRGCPVCAGKLVVKSNCLFNTHKDIASQWHPTKNGNITPHDVTAGSNKKFWWKCDKGDDHEWQTTVLSRKEGRGCPVCSGNKVVKSNSLAVMKPELMKLWHPTKNGDLTPYDVTESSGKRVWWKCDKGDDHEWIVSIGKRNGGSRCPMCLGLKAVKSNCLATLNPDLAKEWHPTKNGELTPYDVTESSGKRVWWKCDKGDDHEWEQSILNRNFNKSSCSVCANVKVVKSNCLATTHPNLAKQWHPTKNGDFTPNDVTAGSNKKAWWKCDKVDDHEWLASITSRKINGCPSCSEHGFDSTADAIFYIRKIILKNKIALKYGITNKIDGSRLKQQKRHVEGSIKTIFKVKNDGLTILRIENKCKKFYRKLRYLSEEEFPDGFSETIKYSEENLNKIKSIVNEVLTEKAEKKL